jgi:cell division septum initiation protein DivIVA
MRRLIAALVIGLAAGLVIQSVRYAGLQKANRQLRDDVVELQKQLATRESAVAPVASTGITEQARSELLRLRNQAAQLRAATNELEQLRRQIGQLRASAQTAGEASGPAAAAAGEMVPRESWRFAGYATPEAAFQSVFFAMSQGDYRTFLESLSPEEAARWSGKSKTPEQLAEDGRREMAKVASYRVLEKDEVSADEVVLVVYAAGGESKVLPMQMRKVGEQWKFAGMATDRRKREGDK